MTLQVYLQKMQSTTKDASCKRTFKRKAQIETLALIFNNHYILTRKIETNIGIKMLFQNLYCNNSWTSISIVLTVGRTKIKNMNQSTIDGFAPCIETLLQGLAGQGISRIPLHLLNSINCLEKVAHTWTPISSSRPPIMFSQARALMAEKVRY